MKAEEAERAWRRDMLVSNKTRIVKLEQARGARARRYCFYFDEVAEAEAQGLPYVLVPRQLSREEWEKRYCHAPDGQDRVHDGTRLIEAAPHGFGALGFEQ
jgi:hypothetical protein